MSPEQPASRAEHGGPSFPELRALGVAATEIIDFSVNLNPYGPHPAVLEAARSADVTRYDDPRAGFARQQLARELDLGAEQLALGNGAAELMWSLASVLSDADRPALIVEPTFSEYRLAVTARGGAIAAYQTDPSQGYAIDLAALSRKIRARRARSVYLCTPNNPTGVACAFAGIAELARAHPRTAIVVDQAFLSLSAHWADAQQRGPENLILLRSLTKDHALPGLRVAYLIASATVVAALEAQRPPWSVSAPAQAALLATFHEERFIRESRERMHRDRDHLDQGLRDLGLLALPSAAPFLLLPCSGASDLRARLLRRHRILVRDCRSFGLADHLRLAARPRAEADRLLAALREERRR